MFYSLGFTSWHPSCSILQGNISIFPFRFTSSTLILKLGLSAKGRKEISLGFSLVIVGPWTCTWEDKILGKMLVFGLLSNKDYLWTRSIIKHFFFPSNFTTHGYPFSYPLFFTLFLYLTIPFSLYFEAWPYSPWILTCGDEALDLVDDGFGIGGLNFVEVLVDIVYQSPL